MTKQELRDYYAGLGWEVPEPTIIDSEGTRSNWQKVSNVEGKVKYDVPVVSPDNKFGTAQVVVTDDGGAGETAVAEGFWKDQPATFNDELRTFLDSKEGGQVYAIVTNEIFVADEAAEVTAYQGASTVSPKRYIVKKRNDTFDFKEVI